MVDDHQLSIVLSAVADGDMLIVRLAGELDLAGAPTLAALAEVLPDRLTTRRVAIDLAELRFADCAGARALHALGQSLSDAGATVTYDGTQPEVSRVVALFDPAASVAAPR